jgi:hypothetical protein
MYVDSIDNHERVERKTMKSGCKESAMRWEVMSPVEYEEVDCGSGDDYSVERGAIRLGSAGEQLWREGNAEFRGMIRAMGNLFLGVMGVREIEIWSSDRSCRHLVDRVVGSEPIARHGWYSWFETDGVWEIVWGSRYRAVVDGPHFAIHRYGKAGIDKPDVIEGRMDEWPGYGERNDEENVRSAMAYVEGYLRALTPGALADWKAFSGRGVRGSVLRDGEDA